MIPHRKKFIIALLFGFACSAFFLFFYINRIHFPEPLKIKVKHNTEYVVKFINIKAVQPFGQIVTLTPDSVNKMWTTPNSYYSAFQFDYKSNTADNEYKNFTIEFYSLKENRLINKLEAGILNGKTFSVNQIEPVNSYGFYKKIFLLLLDHFDFIFIFVFTCLLILIFWKLRFQKLLQKIVVTLFILHGLFWLFVACYYTFPNADALSFVVKFKNGEILNVLRFYAMFIDMRYTTNFMFSICPLSWGAVSLSKFIPITSLVLITITLYFFIVTLFKNILNRSTSLLVSCFIIIVHFSATPSFSDELSWITTIFTYLYAWIFFFLWTTFFIRLLRQENNTIKLVYYILAVFFMICCYGTVEMMIFLNGFVLLIASIHVMKTNRKTFYEIVPFIIIALSITYLIFSAPGTSTRFKSEGIDRNFQFVTGVLTDGNIQFFSVLKDWLFNNKITIPLILLSAFLLNNVNYRSIKEIPYKSLIILFLGLFLLMYLIAFAYYFNEGVKAFAARVFGLIHWVFLIEILLIVPLILIRINIFNRIPIERYRNQLITFLFVFIFLQILISENNLTRIRREYFNGDYSNYRKEMNQRFELLKNVNMTDEWKCVIIDSLETKPKTIFAEPDISIHGLYYWNIVYAAYFGVDEVRIKGDTNSGKNLIIDYVKE